MQKQKPATAEAHPSTPHLRFADVRFERPGAGETDTVPLPGGVGALRCSYDTTHSHLTIEPSCGEATVLPPRVVLSLGREGADGATLALYGRAAPGWAGRYAGFVGVAVVLPDGSVGDACGWPVAGDIAAPDATPDPPPASVGRVVGPMHHGALRAGAAAHFGRVGAFVRVVPAHGGELAIEARTAAAVARVAWSGGPAAAVRLLAVATERPLPRPVAPDAALLVLQLALAVAGATRADPPPRSVDASGGVLRLVPPGSVPATVGAVMARPALQFGAAVSTARGGPLLLLEGGRAGVGRKRQRRPSAVATPSVAAAGVAGIDYA